MEKLKLKHENLCKALGRLEEAVVDFDKFKSNVGNEYDVRLYRSFRDSMIQRFEFCVDLFWKYLKKILEEELKKESELNTPKSVIKNACNAKLITEQNSEEILKMIEDRNKSSHIYKEEIADQISSRIGNYFQIMKKYSDKLIF